MPASLQRPEHILREESWFPAGADGEPRPTSASLTPTGI